MKGVQTSELHLSRKELQINRVKKKKKLAKTEKQNELDAWRVRCKREEKKKRKGWNNG